MKKHQLPLWNSDILKTKSYHEFILFHLKELVRLRFLKEDWDATFKDFLLRVSGEELLSIPFLNSEIPIEKLVKEKNTYQEIWNKAQETALKELQNSNFEQQDFEKWDGFDLIFDFYKIRNADSLAFNNIGKNQIAMYQWIFNQFEKNVNSLQISDSIRQKLYQFSQIFSKFLKGLPNNNFSVNYNTGEIVDLD